jgi:AIPR protein
LTEGLSVRGKTLTLTKVGVVNGCQSLTTLYDNKADITQGLQLLVKVVEVEAHSNVADQITQRSNNQNAVTMRDQRSSDFAMRDLQRNVTKVFASKFALSIRAGEASTATVVFDNALAAQLITAVYLKEPWSAVRKVRLFDQDYRRIFNRNISPHKLRLLHLVDHAIQNARAGLREDLKASFASIRFALAHLVAEVCQLSDEGRALFAEPERWLPGQETVVLNQLQDIAAEVVDSVNFYVESELDTNADLDPKVLFKSKSGVQQLQNDVLRHARREAKRSSYLFDVAPARTSTGATATKRSLRKPATSKVKPSNRNRP